jgi:hypothetical protein
MSLIYKEIQNGAVANSYMYMTNRLIKYGEIFVHFLICISKPVLIHDFSTALL